MSPDPLSPRVRWASGMFLVISPLSHIHCEPTVALGNHQLRATVPGRDGPLLSSSGWCRQLPPWGRPTPNSALRSAGPHLAAHSPVSMETASLPSQLLRLTFPSPSPAGFPFSQTLSPVHFPSLIAPTNVSSCPCFPDYGCWGSMGRETKDPKDQN